MKSRRTFLKWVTALAGAGSFQSIFQVFSTFGASLKQSDFKCKEWKLKRKSDRWPIAISSSNGLRAVEKAYELMQKGTPTIEAVIAGVNINELDPDDHSVGYGGLPNADGIVELDAAVMDGGTWRAGAVGGVHGVKTPSVVARLVMEKTDHIFIVGDGATRFAREYGMKLEDLLTDKSRKRWLKWRAHLSKIDDYLDEDQAEILRIKNRDGDTIHLSAINPEGIVACVTTTSGLPFKIPGRVGDSPIIGAGLYCDPDVGSAGSTGRGEANIKICGAHTIVELMRWGMHPKDACLEALRRAWRSTREKRLLDEKGRPNYQLRFYALRLDGEFGAASMWSEPRGKFAICDEKGPRLLETAYLFEGHPED